MSRLLALVMFGTSGGVMRLSSLIAALASLGLGVAASATTAAHAAELNVLAGGSLTAVLRELAPRFERGTGHKVTIVFDGTPALIKRATSGAPFDLAVTPREVFQDAAARARFAPGPTTDIARVGFGVAVRAGAPKPDIGTPDALKATLLAAKSVTFYPESASGAYLLKLFDRLGIGDAMRAKIKPQTDALQIAPAVARGDAELAVFLSNLLVAPGVDFVGLFPAEVQQDIVLTGAIAADPKEPEAAKAFLAYLTTPEAVSVIKAKGMRPG